MHFEIIDIILPSLFAVLLFWFLFIEKVFPGKGWFAFSVEDVDIKVRILSFSLFMAGIFCGLIGERLFAYILIGVAFSLLILCQ